MQDEDIVEIRERLVRLETKMNIIGAVLGILVPILTIIVIRG